MTTPTTHTPWGDKPTADVEVVSRLSRMVSGNDNLVTQPGLVQALLQNNATPEQAQAIDQFVGGLEAEKLVRTAGQTGQKIKLTDEQQSSLTSMGIDYSPVLYTQKDAVTDLTASMAAQGFKPVFDDVGNVKVDADGNPQAEKIKKESSGGGGGFWHAVGAPFRAIGHLASDVYHGHIPYLSMPDMPGQPSNRVSPADLVEGATGGYNLASSYLVDQGKNLLDPVSAEHQQQQNDELARSLGYDPSSFFSMQAFRARGYYHRDMSSVAKSWDDENPGGKFGWDGDRAVIEAETFAADPKKYRDDIIADPKISPEEAAAKIAAIDSPEFEKLVKRVNGGRADIGAATATAVGIDPVKHSTTFNVTAAGTNLVALFASDPLALGLGAYRNVQMSSAAIKNFADGASITRILKPAEGAATSVAQRRQIMFLNDMVNHTNQLRLAGDDATVVARINAQIEKNPYAALKSDFLGTDQILGMKASEAMENAGRGELPFVTGKAAPIDTFDKAVDYLASKSALLRVQGGYAPIETSVMPGAMSSYAFTRFRANLSSWSAGRGAAKSEQAASRFLDSVATSPERLAEAKKQGLVTEADLSRILPAEDDAVDFATGSILAGGQKVEGELASARRAELAITDAGRGALRGNKIRYGLYEAPETKLGKIASIYTLGTAQRAKVVLARFTNWLPRDTALDLTAASSPSTVMKVAKTYLSNGDAQLLSARWARGDSETRKTIAVGVMDQIAHAAGLPRTQAGRDMMERWHAQQEKYLAYGDEFVDANGTPGAMYPGQVSTSFQLPNFGKVHQAAAKIGLYEGTIGRVLTSQAADRLMTLWKVNVLMSPVTAVRANVESWLNAAADGMFKSGAQAKAILRDAGKLGGEDISRSRGVDKVLSLTPLQAAGRFYRHNAQRGLSDAEIVAIRDIPEDIMHSYIHEQAAYHYALNVDPAGTTEATAIAQAGLRASRISYDTKEGFEAAVKTRKGYEVTDEVDGIAGANAYAHNLAMRVNKSPHVAHAIIARIEDPELGSQHVIDALESGSAKNLMQHSMFGKVFRDSSGKQQRALTEDESAIGKQQWADAVTEDFRQLVTGRNGTLQTKINDYIKTHGKAPDADWILDSIKKQNRPQHLLRPVIVAQPTNPGVKGLVDALVDVEGKGYQWLVERLIQRHTTTPLFAGAYGKSKVELEDFKQALIRDHSFTETAAERTTAQIAAHQAWNRIARMVDDPNLKSQMDVVGRSFFAFSRATTMMLRRWGSTLWRNPAQARRLQLAGEAAVHSGLVYQDESTGDWMFRFPASGVAQEVLMHAMSNIPGLDGLAQFPVSDFTGRVSTIVPGSANPFQYSTSPVVSISGRWLADRFPEHRALFDEVDRFLNGDQGQGRGVFATLEPALLKKFTDAWQDDRNSLTSSAMIGSLYNLYAAGLVPKDGASHSEMEEFFGRLKTQTKSNLFLRAILGVVSPAVIGVPMNENDASKADYAFAASGAQGLRDEYKAILNAADGDVARASAIWTALHPDLTVYTQSASQATTSRAVMPATKAALTWMNNNLGFINKYKSVAAFFIPEQSNGDPFSMSAYRAQLEEGLRQRKSPQEFLDGVRVSAAASTYYAVEDQYKADLAAAKASGNDAAATRHRADWLAWSKQFKALHPTFAIKTEGSAANVRDAQNQLADLRAMLNHGDVPSGFKEPLTGMLAAYDGYEQYRQAHPGQDNQSRAAKSSALSMFQDYMTQVVQAYPQIGDLYSGVFRVINTHLESLN